jgi:hypothetical protein
MNKLNNKNSITDKKAARQARREAFVNYIGEACASANAMQNPYGYYLSKREYKD